MPKNDDDKLEKMLRKLGEEKVDYPNLENRRRSFIGQILLNKYFWLIVFTLFMVILCIVLQGIH